MNFRKWLTVVLAVMLSLGKIEAADGSMDFFQQVGKMYVVVVVIVIMVIGLALYLYRLDRKISNLEQNASHGKE